eukprot:TRINITY_DN66516_c0_g1_i1.p1 TRINITY_DN66516_c0_g1~~TRINITY_DN66516_c0_g1_i1.p1  ORF type:complete len:474 (-),score=108.42 TRINITY_DN66516_c0_g1_i1:94-1515(-)
MASAGIAVPGSISPAEQSLSEKSTLQVHKMECEIKANVSKAVAGLREQLLAQSAKAAALKGRPSSDGARRYGLGPGSSSSTCSQDDWRSGLRLAEAAREFRSEAAAARSEAERRAREGDVCQLRAQVDALAGDVQRLSSERLAGRLLDLEASLRLERQARETEVRRLNERFVEFAALAAESRHQHAGAASEAVARLGADVALRLERADVALEGRLSDLESEVRSAAGGAGRGAFAARLESIEEHVRQSSESLRDICQAFRVVEEVTTGSDQVWAEAQAHLGSLEQRIQHLEVARSVPAPAAFAEGPASATGAAPGAVATRRTGGSLSLPQGPRSAMGHRNSGGSPASAAAASTAPGSCCGGGCGTAAAAASAAAMARLRGPSVSNALPVTSAVAAPASPTSVAVAPPGMPSSVRWSPSGVALSSPVAAAAGAGVGRSASGNGSARAPEHRVIRQASMPVAEHLRVSGPLTARF